MEKIKGKIPEPEKGIIRMHFSGGRKLSIDFVNAYASLQTCFNYNKDIFFKELKPVQTYEEYFRNSSPRSYSFNMELSDKETIIALDKLIVAFNLDLERIKRERDITTAKSFFENIANLMSLKR